MVLSYYFDVDMKRLHFFVLKKTKPFDASFYIEYIIQLYQNFILILIQYWYQLKLYRQQITFHIEFIIFFK